MSEETKGSKSTPGRAATITVVIIVLIYLFVAIGAMVYAGVGTGELGLGNPDIQENVFFAVAGPVMGPAAILTSLAILSSSAASLQSTFVSPTRTLLAMGHYGALPSKFAKVHPCYFTPGFAIIVSAVTAGVFYAIMRFLSEAVLWDTISTLGIMICFYYGLTALSCVWYFRKQWFTSAHNFFFKFLFPLVGGLVLAVLFSSTLIESMDPSFGSGSEIDGIGLVFILAVVLILVGVFLMLVCSVKYPGFFKGRTRLQKGLL